MVSVVALGDANVDIIAEFDSYPGKGEDALAHTTEIHCGGSAANTAITLAHMGIETALIARVGPDSWALKVLNCLKEAGVDPGGLQRDPEAMTGMMYVVVTPDGERTILGQRGANVFTDPEQIDEAMLRQAQVFHLSGYSLLAEPQRSAALLALEIACRHGLTVTLDPGMTVSHSALEEMRALLPAVDVLLPNLSEAQEMTGLELPRDCAQRLLDLGAKAVALKLGRDGCLVGNEEDLCEVPAFPVEVRDSTGAGDCFAAGFIAGLLGSLDLAGCALLGAALGAMSAARVGAASVAPKSQQVLALLGNLHRQATHFECRDSIEQVIRRVLSLSTRTEEEKPWWA